MKPKNITVFSGPEGSGKSVVIGNITRNQQPSEVRTFTVAEFLSQPALTFFALRKSNPNQLLSPLNVHTRYVVIHVVVSQEEWDKVLAKINTLPDPALPCIFLLATRLTPPVIPAQYTLVGVK